MLSSQDATINMVGIQEEIKNCNFTEKNVCFVGNLSEDPLKTTLGKIGHCAYGTSGQESKKKLIDLIIEGKPDDQFIQRILTHEAQSAIAELDSKAIVLVAFGYERYCKAIRKAVSIPVLSPSPILARLLKAQDGSSIGLIGASFDLDQKFWDDFSQEHGIKVILPEKDAVIKLGKALKRSIELKGQTFKTELEQICSEQVKTILAGPEPPGHILFCNIELDYALKRIGHEKSEHAKFLSMLDVLRRLVVDFKPPDTKSM